MPRLPRSLLLLAAVLGGLSAALPRPGNFDKSDPYLRLRAATAWVRAANHGTGTGWVVDRRKRWLVTCYHVIGESEAIEVVFPWRSGGKVESSRRETLARMPALRKSGRAVRARVVKRMPKLDLALLELASLPDDVEALSLAEESALPGTRVHLVGNRYDVDVLWTYAGGEVRLSQSLSKGYFSAGKRLAQGATVLLASVPINEGDSGGPLVDDAGRLVGVAAAVEWEAHGAGLFIDVRHVRELIGQPASRMPQPGPLDAAAIYRQTVGSVALVQYEGGPRAAGIVVDRQRRLVVTTASAVSRDDDVIVTFAHRQGRGLVVETAWYRSQDHLLRQRGRRSVGVVLAIDVRRNLALIEAGSVPDDAAGLRFSAKQPRPGDRLHLISHPRQLPVLWAYGAAYLRQIDAVYLAPETEGPAPAVLILQAPLGDREAGGPMLDARGEVVGLLAGKIGPQQQLGYALTASEVEAFLVEHQALARPASAADRLGRAQVFLGAYQFDRAIAECTQALTLEPKNGQTMAMRAWASYRIGKDGDAIGDASRAITLDEKQTLAWTARAAASARGGKIEAALADAEQAVKRDAKSALAFAIRAQVRLAAGQSAGAITDADEAVWLDARLALAYRVRGLAQTRRGMIERAISDLGRAIARDPRNARTLVERGELYLKRNDREAALSDFEQALKLSARDARALHGRGRCRLARGEYAEGMADLNAALLAEPTRVDPLIDRGGERIRRGDYRLAVADFLRAARTRPALVPEILGELDRRAEAHLADDPARAAELYSDTLGGIAALVKPVGLRQQMERELAAARKLPDALGRRQALRSIVRLVRDRWGA